MINYAHLKSQMIQLLDLLRSILYPNVFDAMEEAHSKFHILSHGFFACILYHFAPSFVNTNSFFKAG